MYFSGHLTDEYSEYEKDIAPKRIASVVASFDEMSPTSEFSEGQSIALTGVITERKTKNTKNGETMAFLTLEDRTGEIEIIVFPKTYTEYAALFNPDAVIAVYGEITVRDEEEPKIILKAAAPMRSNDRYTHRQSPFAELENAPQKRYQKPVSAPAPAVAVQKDTKKPIAKLFLRVTSTDSAEAKKAINLVGIFDGNIPVIFYETENSKYVQRADLKIDATPFVISELKKLLGDENVVEK